MGSWRWGMVRAGTVAVLGLGVSVAPAGAQTPAPLGSEFQVNTYTTNQQTRVGVGAEPDGDFVVVWDSYGSSGTDTSSWSIQARRYASSGASVGTEFQVNTYTTGYQATPVVAVEPDGEFTVVWSDTRIRGQRYASNGAPAGAEFQVNTDTLVAFRPSVATDPDGDLVVVWSTNEGLLNFEVRGRRYASNGSPVGGEFQVSTYNATVGGGPVFFAGPRPAVAAEPDGDFVVVWQSGSYGTDSSAYSVQGQRFSSNGSPVGGQFQANTYTTNDQSYPAAATQPDGSFVVVWQSDGSSGTDTSGSSIQGQRYASNGSLVGGQFQVNTWTTTDQYYPAVAAQQYGTFVVVWDSNASIRGQRYAFDGSTLGGEFQVSIDPSYYHRPAAAATPGGVVVAWTGDDAFSRGVKGRRVSNFDAPIGPIVNPANSKHSYYLLPAMDWATSEVLAGSLGGHLATIDDAAENAWVFSTFENFGDTPRNLWIGLTDVDQEGTFVWRSGAPVGYTNWRLGEPNNNGDEDFAMIFNRFEPGAPDGRWNDMFAGQAVFGPYPINGVVEVEPAEVPSLSPGAAAAAALLMLAAAAVAFRKRA